MATWEEPNGSKVWVDAPATANDASRWDFNVVALAEGADDAPRISPKATGGTVSIGEAVGVVLLTGFDGYGGANVEVKYNNSAAGATTMTVELSANGTTFSAAADVAAVGGNSYGSVTIFVDFETGDVNSVWSGIDGAGSYSETAGTPAGDVSHIRITAGGTTTTDIGVMALMNAGSVA